MWNWGWEIWWHILDGSTCILDSYNVWIALNDFFIYWEHSHPDIRFIIYRHTCEDEIGCWCYIHEAFSLLQRHGKQWLPLENLKLLYFGALHHAKASSTSYPGIDYLTRSIGMVSPTCLPSLPAVLINLSDLKMTETGLPSSTAHIYTYNGLCTCRQPPSTAVNRQPVVLLSSKLLSYLSWLTANKQP